MVVTDSGPLIALARLDLLPLLRRRFDTVLVPETVFLECTRRGDRPGALAIASASDAGLLHRTHVTGADRFAAENLLDAGESAALVLARRRAVPVLVDERKARQVAARLGIPVVGTVGVLVAARKAKIRAAFSGCSKSWLAAAKKRVLLRLACCAAWRA